MMSTLFVVILVAVAWTVVKLKRARSLVAGGSKYGLIRVRYTLFSYDVTEAMLLHQNKSRNQFWNRTDFLSTNVLLL